MAGFNLIGQWPSAGRVRRIIERQRRKALRDAADLRSPLSHARGSRARRALGLASAAAWRKQPAPERTAFHRVAMAMARGEM